MQNLKPSLLFALNLLSLDSLINVLPDRKKILREGNFEALNFYIELVFKQGNELEQARTLANDFY